MNEDMLYMTCVQVICLGAVDYFDIHGFGLESGIVLSVAIVITLIHKIYRGKK